MVEETAARENFSRVATLRLEVGVLAGVQLQALRFALDAIAPGTCLEGSNIEFDEPPGRAWCERCMAEVLIDSRVDPCPRCNGYPVKVTGGAELRILDLLVLDN